MDGSSQNSGGKTTPDAVRFAVPFPGLLFCILSFTERQFTFLLEDDKCFILFM